MVTIVFSNDLSGCRREYFAVSRNMRVRWEEGGRVGLEGRPSKEAVTTVLMSADEVLGMEMERKDDRDAGRNRML